MGRSLGAPGDPLLVSRALGGAKFSMPGMMETVLNVGLNDESVQGLASSSDNPRFAHDSYRRLLHMFGGTVLGIEGELFRDALDDLKKDRGTTADTDLGVEDLQELIETYKAHHREGSRPARSPRSRASSSTSPSAPSSTRGTPTAPCSTAARSRSPRTSAPPSTSRRWCSATSAPTPGSGVCFTRDPASGDQGVYGDYLQNAQGEDVVAGIRNTVSLADMAEIDKASHDELLAIMSTLEHHYKDMCDIEFTVERGKLWMLQTRVGKRTPEAAFRIAVHMADEGLIDMDEALRRVNGEQLANLMFPRFDEKAERTLLAKGMNASPGAAVGKAVFDWATAVEWAERGRGRHPRPQGDHPRRPARDDGRPRRAHQPRRQDLARRRGRARHGPYLRLRRRGPRRGRPRGDVRGAQRPDGPRGRRHLDRRVDGRGVPRRRPGDRRRRWCATSRASRSTSPSSRP